MIIIAKKLARVLPGTIISGLCCIPPMQAQAQGPTDVEAVELEQLVVTGSRRAARSVFDSTVPIDLIHGDDLGSRGAVDVTDLLRETVPSFHVNTQPLSDAATVVRPANLRGLAPDHTLTLLNNKRRHRSAVITWLGNGVSDGAQGPDISVFPAIALRQVEVLRDGDAARYGSDAIAGVINFMLKDDDSGGRVETRYGIHEAGDGEAWSVSGNAGMPLTERGFLNLSFEYGGQRPTVRTVELDQVKALRAEGVEGLPDQAFFWGNPLIDGDLKTTLNLGISLGETMDWYAFGNYAGKTVEGGFFYRNPNTRSGVYSSDGGATRLVGDLAAATSGGEGSSPVVAIGDDAALAAVVADPNLFVFNELLPGGFTPRFGADTQDIGLVTGVRGELGSGLRYDLSGSLGYNRADFFIFNTVNASLGPDTPTSFDPGAYTQFERNVNLDLSKPFPVEGLASDLNVAVGFEAREEEFEITEGEPDSWMIGPLAPQGFSGGSNGFPGFSPLAVGKWSQSNIAAYLDLEADVTSDWLAGLAFRGESHEGLGDTGDVKISSLYRVSPEVSLRGSVSTGFRAPTPGQANAFNVSTNYDPALGDLVNSGVIPPASPPAMLRGGRPIEAEESENATFGALWEWAGFRLTADYFRIELQGRIAISQEFELTPEEAEVLIAEGFASAGNLQRFRFFTNDFDTVTEGVDVVAGYTLDYGPSQTFINFAYNHTKTEITDFSPEVIDETRIREVEHGVPANRWLFSLLHTRGPWSVTARYSYYGSWYDSQDDLDYSGYGLVDGSVSHAFKNGITVTLGADNLLDTTPAEYPLAAATTGNRYSQYAPGGFSGRFQYVRLGYEF